MFMPRQRERQADKTPGDAGAAHTWDRGTITFESTRDTSGSPPAVAFGVVVRWRSHIQVAFEKPNGLLVEGRSSVKDA